MELPTFRSFAIPSLLMILAGWGGLALVVFFALPYVWYRWGFFILLTLALSGTVMPIVYFFHRRFPTEPPAESHVIVRQSVWFGVYVATLAWLQLGRLVTVYVILGLAGGLLAIEYFLRLRESARWKPPILDDDTAP